MPQPAATIDVSKPSPGVTECLTLAVPAAATRFTAAPAPPLPGFQAILKSLLGAPAAQQDGPQTLLPQVEDATVVKLPLKGAPATPVKTQAPAGKKAASATDVPDGCALADLPAPQTPPAAACLLQGALSTRAPASPQPATPQAGIGS